MNDWKANKFLRVVLVIQLVMLVLIGLDALGFKIPVLRQIVGFVYLTFIPGLVILRLLRLHNLGTVRTLLYSVGLSLAFNMFIGFFINVLYPHIGIARPISTLPLIITWTVVLGILSFIAYRRDKDFFSPTHFKVGDLLSPPVLLLLLLPLLAVLGTQLVNFYQSNIVLMILICLIGLVPILVIFTRLIPEKFYPLAIYSIALALLWHFSLVSRYLIHYDSFLEYYFFSLVNGSGLWDSGVPHDFNAMLSVTILPATFCQLLDISGTEIFKVIYQVWYALVPLGVYWVSSKLLNSKRAFLAAFFFMSIALFYFVMPCVARQEVAELFCVLLIMLVIDGEATPSKKTLFMIFGASLVVSHYGLSYIYMAFLVLGITTLHLVRKKSVHITAYSVALFIVLCLAWYMYMAGSVPLARFTNLGKHIYESFSLEFLNPFSRDFSYYFTVAPSNALYQVYLALWYLMLFFTAVGAVTLVSDLRQKKLREDYATLAFGNYILLGVCIAVPFFSNTLSVQRMVQIASLVLAPFCILGAEIIFRSFLRVIQFVRYRTSRRMNTIITASVSILLVLFFLFNIRLPFEIANSADGRPLPLALGHVTNGDKAISLSDTIQFRISTPTVQEVSSAEWLSKFRNEERGVYGTYWQLGVPVLVSYGMISPWQTYDLTPLTTIKDIKGTYVYLGYVNVVLGYGTTITVLGQPDPVLGNILQWDISLITPLLDSSAKVYANRTSEIYLSP